MDVTLITGASEGIGKELALLEAESGRNVLLVARRETLLAALSQDIEGKYPVKAPIMICDLSRPGAASTLFQEILSRGYKVTHLINNAGVGDFVAFRDSNPEKMEAMMQLNMMALAQLTRLFIPSMLQRGEGRILQVASVAAFQPGPMMAVYFATKAFVLHFSEALHEELRGTGVTVTCLCPGVTETGFFTAADMHQSKAVKGKSLSSAREVARCGHRAMLRGRRIVIPGLKNRLLVFCNRISPRALTVKITRHMMEARD